ncbi:MAG TPA: hypothetical protein VEK07_09640 [Polyangiaceae bacterium]|nr:hypothetical protein [Polyangiaceae bacterium]
MIRAKFTRFLRFVAASPLGLGLVLALAAGCDEQGAEGDRCNPYLSHNDCNSGLICSGYPPSTVVIPFCQENYCCPVDSNGNVTGTNPNCQPGCNGSAAVICSLTMDPGACLIADGGSLQAALALDDASASSSETVDSAASDVAVPVDSSGDGSADAE